MKTFSAIALFIVLLFGIESWACNESLQRTVVVFGANGCHNTQQALYSFNQRSIQSYAVQTNTRFVYVDIQSNPVLASRFGAYRSGSYVLLGNNNIVLRRGFGFQPVRSLLFWLGR